MTSHLLHVVRVLLITVVSALRHYEDDSSGASKVVFLADAPGLDFDEPMAAPRYRKKAAEALVELNKTKETCKNDNLGKLVNSHELLGQGEYAKVYKVRTASVTKFGRKSFAMKVPHAGDTEALEAAEHEKKIMRATSKHQCRHVLPLVEEDPCVDGEQQTHAILTSIARWDLGKWKRKWKRRGRVPRECAEPVYHAIEEGLKCMHEAGYAHGDLKGPNVLFEDLDERGCPTGIQLADFGISDTLGSFREKYPAEFYTESPYLPGTMFADAPDSLDLTEIVEQDGDKYEFYKVDARLDDCSFAMMMWDLFRLQLPEMQERLGRGGCGPMGRGRRLSLP